MESTKKVLGVGIFYLLGGILAVVPFFPTPVPSLLLGSGMALLVYNFLGGIAQDDRINWSVGQKAAIQIGGASVILLASSYGINFYLDKWKQNNSLVIEPESQNLIVLNQKGESVEVKLRRGGLPEKIDFYKGDLRNLNLSIHYMDGRLFVQPSGSKKQNFILGNIDDPDPNQPSPLTKFILETSQNDYFNQTLIDLRKAVCEGQVCPNSLAGFPVLVKADGNVTRRELSVCVSDLQIKDEFAKIPLLYIAPSKDSPLSDFKEFKVALVSLKERVPRCIREGKRVIALMHPDDLEIWSKKSIEKGNKREMHAATSPP
jgi:hypothetical protein